MGVNKKVLILILLEEKILFILFVAFFLRTWLE